MAIAIAIDLGVIDGNAVAEFLGGNVLIAAPTVGVWPAEWTVLVLEALETVVAEFEKRVGVPRDGYQQRAVGFCCERLHALLALRLVSSWPREKVVANRLLVVSEDGTATASRTSARTSSSSSSAIRARSYSEPGAGSRASPLTSCPRARSTRTSHAPTWLVAARH